MFLGNQKIIAVDDNFDEVKPLLTALWKKGLPCIYLNGSLESLPKKPYSGTRLLFLDIELETKGSSVSNTASTLAARIERIIGKKPSPYFIVFWTKNKEEIAKTLGYLKTVGIAPVGYIDFEKPSKGFDDNLTDKLFADIESKLKNLGAYNYLMDWESKIEASASEFSSTFFSLVNTDGDEAVWSNKTSAILGKLACAHTGNKSLGSVMEDEVKNSFHMLGVSFKDTLDSNIKRDVVNRKDLTLEPVDVKSISKMNATLFFDFHPDQKTVIGNVILDSDHQVALLKGLKQDIFGNAEFQANCDVVAMIITPSCDLAQEKNFLYNKETCIGYYRVLYGLFFPYTADNYKAVKDNKALFRVEPFYDTNKEEICLLVFHFGTLSSKWMPKRLSGKVTPCKLEACPPEGRVAAKAAEPNDRKESGSEAGVLGKNPLSFDSAETTMDSIENHVDMTYIFRLKEALVFDIQSQMANHAYRIGNTMLKVK